MTKETAPDPGRKTARETTKEQWVAIGELDQLEPDKLLTIKVQKQQLVVGRDAAGDWFALDNRCPHEGYPLAQGALKDSTLTCCWHNWKFDTRTGECLLGGEDVRHFATRCSGGRLWVDLADPPAEILQPKYLTSLRSGLLDGDVARSIRDVVRLLESGYSPHLLLADLAAWDAEVAEFGSTHVLALSADCGRYLERYPGVRAAFAMAPVVDLFIEGNVRLRPRARPHITEDVIVAAQAETDSGRLFQKLRQVVETEETEEAERLLSHAFHLHEQGRVSIGEIDSCMYSILSEHFLDFGHELIYLVKLQELMKRVPVSYARRIYPALLYAICVGTREDTLPYMKNYFQGSWPDELEELFERQGVDSPAPLLAFREVVLDGSRGEAVAALHDALRRGVHRNALARELVVAAAQRLLRFDEAVDRAPDWAENWLFATHRLTFAAACRHAVLRFRKPDSLRFLFQAVAFIHSARKMDMPQEQRPDSRRRAGKESPGFQEVLAAVKNRQGRTALDAAADCLAATDSRGIRSLQSELMDHCLRDPMVRPIYVAHLIKTLVVGFEERAALGDHPERDAPVLAAIRFLSAKTRERRTYEVVQTSLDWVLEGKIPRKLTQ